MNTKEIVEKLSAPFAANEIEWRAGSTNKEKTQALALAYINARSVMNRLDDVVGAENWSDSYQVITGEGKRGYICTLSIRLNGEWVGKSDGADESDFEATKGGLSDAFKRAANKWGIGRYLYNLDAVWVPCQEFGRTVKLTKTPQLPAWALPQKNKALEEFGKAQAQKAEAEPQFTLADALHHENSEGQPYGEITTNKLAIMWNAMAKSIEKNHLEGDERAKLERKMKAAKMIVDARKSGEIADVK